MVEHSLAEADDADQRLRAIVASSPVVLSTSYAFLLLIPRDAPKG